jgi:homoaconitate hydratase
VNARLEDIAAAASVVRGKKVAAGVEFYVAAASAEIEREARARGDWQTLLDAGAIALPSGCGPCIGLGRGTVGDGEVGISATNRNFKGRMGSRDAQVYLASPAVVAASALAGHICAPEPFAETPARFSMRRGGGAAGGGEGEVEIIDGFPERVRARALFIPKDNLNTDGIFAGKWTYKDDMTSEEMAAVVFENYDPDFSKIYKKGDVVVAGRNFGSGSSREQAATALIHRGIPCVIAASFSETYKRNAFNNGFGVFQCPELVDHLAATLGAKAPTIAGPDIEIDYRRSTITCDGRTFRFPPLGRVPQELIVAGGAENLVRSRLA